MPKQPIELMFGAYRRQLLALLLLRPDEQFHVRELARMSGIPAGSVHRELKVMAEAGLLVREQSGNQVYYQANRACPIYEELAVILSKTQGLAFVLRDALEPLATNIAFAWVFGSMAAGHQSQSSDIDLLVLGDITLVDVVRAVSGKQDYLGREINPVVMGTEKFLQLLKHNDRFASRVMSEPRISVMGDPDEFAELVANRAA